MIAVLGGLVTALMWATSNLAASRTTKVIGPWSALAWIMMIGLVLNVGAIAAFRVPAPTRPESWGWMAVAGFGSVAALFLVLSALRFGKVGVVTATVSTEGGVAATYSIAGGERLSSAALLCLVVVAAAVAFTAAAPDDRPVEGQRGRRAVGLALAAALCGGAGIFATGKVGGDVELLWATLPGRVVGVTLIAVPLLLTRRIRITRPTAPLLAVTGVAELAGFAALAWGSRQSIAITAVLSSLFATFAAVGAYLLFRERLTPRQIGGVAVIAIGVMTLTAITAGS